MMFMSFSTRKLTSFVALIRLNKQRSRISKHVFVSCCTLFRVVFAQMLLGYVVIEVMG